MELLLLLFTAESMLSFFFIILVYFTYTSLTSYAQEAATEEPSTDAPITTKQQPNAKDGKNTKSVKVSRNKKDKASGRQTAKGGKRRQTPIPSSADAVSTSSSSDGVSSTEAKCKPVVRGEFPFAVDFGSDENPCGID